MSADAWDIETGYWDTSGQWHDVPGESIEAIEAAMGAGPDRDRPPAGPPMWFVGGGEAHRLNGPAEITLEDGTAVRAGESLPPDLPFGYHDLRPLDGGPATRLVVTPRRCHLPDDWRTFGFAVQLYATRSTQSWGIGDLGDLGRLADWARGLGAGMLALNPLHAAAPVTPVQPSPYYPTSRRFRNPLFLRVEDIPGAAEAGADLETLAKAGRELNDRPRIDRDEIVRVKNEALRLLWDRFRPRGDAAFTRFCEDGGEPLRTFALFCAIAEEHGGGFDAWPENLRRPDASGVARFAIEHADRVRYHQWLQWLLDLQLDAAGRIPLVQDLAIGFDPGGADAWAWQDLVAHDMRVGAPPDDFNMAGQDWGLPPFVPWKLRDAYYEPFIETIRSGLHHAGGLRIDHVMGLFRLFWIPPESGPKGGAYVRYPHHELLDIVALESHRAGAFVVGEDLGTVTDEARHELWARGVLSYRLLWFEPGPTREWPEQALAAVSTHDLPTIAGVWSGVDIEAQREAGLTPNEDGEVEVRGRLERAAGLPSSASVEDVVVATHRNLAEAPSRVLLATLDDVCGVPERPNMPGTVDEWPNWSLPLPLTVEELEQSDQARAVADALRR